MENFSIIQRIKTKEQRIIQVHRHTHEAQQALINRWRPQPQVVAQPKAVVILVQAQEVEVVHQVAHPIQVPHQVQEVNDVTCRKN